MLLTNLFPVKIITASVIKSVALIKLLEFYFKMNITLLNATYTYLEKITLKFKQLGRILK